MAAPALRRDVADPVPASHIRTWAALERSHGWSHERMEAWQVNRLQSMVDHAHRRVPMYSSRGPAPSFTSLDGFRASVPVIEPVALRSAALETRLAGPVPDGTQQFTTSGSTGRTAPVLYPPVVQRLLGGMSWRMRRRRGARPDWRWATVSATARTDVIRRRFKLLVPAHIDAQRVAALLDDFRPHVLSGYPHLLLDAASHRARPEPLRLVTTFGEQLDDATRQGLREQYGVEPADTYGANEFGAIAWQCRHADLYHLNHELVLVEVLDDRGWPCPPGSDGSVVVTDLANALFPHLRYALGDVARLADRPCACGHRLPALEALAGRQLDWLEGADGTRIAPERLWMDLVLPMDVLEPIERYRVHQRADGSVVVLLVLHDEIDPAAVERIRRGYAELLGPGIAVAVELVDEIPRTVAGKYPMVTSDRHGARSDASAGDA